MDFDYINLRADVVAELSRKDLKYEDLTSNNMQLSTVKTFMGKGNLKRRKPSINVAEKIAKRLGMDFDKYIVR